MVEILCHPRKAKGKWINQTSACRVNAAKRLKMIVLIPRHGITAWPLPFGKTYEQKKESS
jgi:hypothetical protein